MPLVDIISFLISDPKNGIQWLYKSSYLDSLVVIPLGGEHDGAAVDLEAADPGEGTALVDELPVLVALAPLQDAVEGVWTNQRRVLWPAAALHQSQLT